jgi:carbamoyl-phosphate synthase small subunit
MNSSQLILESGEAFSGLSPSWQEDIYFGEVVFSTGMTGYVESLTDPSYSGQIVTFTYPLIGNYGVPDPKYWESAKLQASGVIVSTASSCMSHWDAKSSFLHWLQEQKIPLITNVDTRALTKILRKKGVAVGAICRTDAKIKKFPDFSKIHFVKQVSLPQKQEYGAGPKTVIAVDCGIKENILRCLSKFPIKIIRVPYDYDYTNDHYDGLFISNGPGDPAVCTETISILKKSLARKKPTFGICLGAQLLALAIGSKTYKLKFGHRGHNQPCRNLDTNICILTSQNHGYAIDEKTLPKNWRVSFRNLNDQSVEGIAHNTLPFFAVQFHPESHPGPTDAEVLFEQFYKML